MAELILLVFDFGHFVSCSGISGHQKLCLCLGLVNNVDLIIVI